jgi:hypothetical protein
MYMETVQPQLPVRHPPPRGWREGNKTRKRTLANLSDWPKEKIENPQMGWITALTSEAIRGLLAERSLQLTLLDQQNLVEIPSREYP